MKDIITLLRNEFENDIEKNGLLWRLSRPNTFIDLLMLESYKIKKEGFDYNSCLNVILFTFKGIFNMTNKIIDPLLDFDEVVNELNLEESKIKTEFIFYVEKAQEQNKIKECQSSSVEDEITQFKVLNNLGIDNYSVTVFEKAFYYFVYKMAEIKHP